MFIRKAVATSSCHKPYIWHWSPKAMTVWTSMILSHITLTSEMTNDSNRSVTLVRQAMKVLVCSLQPVMIIESALDQGWGARCGDTSAGGRRKQSSTSISWSFQLPFWPSKYLSPTRDTAKNGQNLLCHPEGRHTLSSNMCKLALKIWGWRLHAETDNTTSRAHTWYSKPINWWICWNTDGLIIKLHRSLDSMSTNVVLFL